MKADASLVYSFGTALGAILGFLLHVVMSWGEWRKIGGNAQLGFKDFVFGDAPAFLSALLTNIILYFSLPQIGQMAWVSQLIGFQPQMNFFSAAVLAIASNAIAIKIRNIGRKLNGDS